MRFWFGFVLERYSPLQNREKRITTPQHRLTVEVLSQSTPLLSPSTGESWLEVTEKHPFAESDVTEEAGRAQCIFSFPNFSWWVVGPLSFWCSMICTFFLATGTCISGFSREQSCLRKDPSGSGSCLWQHLPTRSEHVTVMVSMKEAVPGSTRRPATANSSQKGPRGCQRQMHCRDLQAKWI